MDHNTINLFHEKTRDLAKLYLRIKEAIILAENLDPDSEIYIAPLNQLRNAFDHIMKASLNPEKMLYELNEAKEHINRAGNDTFELLSFNLSLSIIESLKKYDNECICKVYPEYYNEVKPFLISIKEELSKIRAHKTDINPYEMKSFEEYSESVSKLIIVYKTVQQRIPSMQEYKSKQKNRLFWNITIPIITAIVGAILTYLIKYLPE